MHAALIPQLARLAKNMVRELDPDNDLEFLRIRSLKHEIMVAPRALSTPAFHKNYCSTIQSFVHFPRCLIKGQQKVRKLKEHDETWLKAAEPLMEAWNPLHCCFNRAVNSVALPKAWFDGTS